MKNLAWITDPHLNFLTSDGREAFYAELAQTSTDAFVLTGDIGEAPDVALFLKALDERLQRPIYFVLGNHDFYRGSFAVVREKITALCEACPNLHWMPAEGVIPLTETSCLIGHDGWADARRGDFWNSDVRMNDWRFIGEFIGLDKSNLLAKLNALGDESAAHFRAALPEALDRFEHVYVLTHVPPFAEGCTWMGRQTNDNWLPHVCNKVAGDVLTEAMKTRPDRTMTVLCGHTHQPADAMILPNLRVITGGANYYEPKVQRTLEVR